MISNAQVNLGDLPTKMPARYWIGLAAVAGLSFLIDLPGRDHLDPTIAIYLLDAAVATLWFLPLARIDGFGIWCLLPLFVLLVRAKGGVVDALPPNHSAGPFLAMVPLAVFVLAYLRSLRRQPDE